MNTQKVVEETLKEGRQSGLYRLKSGISESELRELAQKMNFSFYYIDGHDVVNRSQLIDVLKNAFDWPEWAATNWDAVFDVMTMPEYYRDTDGKAIVLYDQCHFLSDNDPISFNVVVGILKDMQARFTHYLKHPTMAGKSYQVYSLVRGTDEAFDIVSAEYKPIPFFI